MADVGVWSQTAAGNQFAVPDGGPEGMDRQDLNDWVRENMSAVRRFYEEPQWIDLLKEGGAAADFTVSKIDATHVNIVHDVTPTDARAKFPTGARIRLDDGVTKLVGFVVTATYAAPNTSVEVDIDGGTDVQAGVNKIERHITGGTGVAGALPHTTDMGRAAWSPIGVTLAQDPPQLPSIDLLGNGVTLNQGHDPEGDGSPGINADLLDGFHAADFASALTERSLVNAGFNCWQRGTTIDSTRAFPNDNGKYTADQWILLMGDGVTRPGAGLGVVDLTRETTDLPAGVAGYACKITGNANVGSPTAEKVGLLQIMPRSMSERMNNQKVSVSFWAKAPAGSTYNLLQVGIIEWQGASDNLGAWAGDPINSWSAPAVVPTLDANFVFSGTSVPTGFAPSDTWTEFKLENVQVSASSSNLGILIWIDDQSWALGSTLLVTGVTMSLGTVARTFQPQHDSDDLVECQAFFEGTFEPDEEPQENLGDSDGAAMEMGNHSSGEALINWEFRTPKFKTPTIVTYNPHAAGALVRNLDDSTNTAIVTTRTTKRKTSFETSTGADANDILAVHATAEAVL
jgi:hypothetical protein